MICFQVRGQSDECRGMITFVGIKMYGHILVFVRQIDIEYIIGGQIQEYVHTTGESNKGNHTSSLITLTSDLKAYHTSSLITLTSDLKAYHTSSLITLTSYLNLCLPVHLSILRPRAVVMTEKRPRRRLFHSSSKEYCIFRHGWFQALTR